MLMKPISFHSNEIFKTEVVVNYFRSKYILHYYDENLLIFQNPIIERYVTLFTNSKWKSTEEITYLFKSISILDLMTEIKLFKESFYSRTRNTL